MFRSRPVADLVSAKIKPDFDASELWQIGTTLLGAELAHEATGMQDHGAFSSSARVRLANCYGIVSRIPDQVT